MSFTEDKQVPCFAVVAEGGGQKGIFTAGVLDSFLDQQFWPFHLKVGVSAGAQNLTAYCARARQYAKNAIVQLTTSQAFFRPSRFFTGGNVIDLDWYFQQVEPQGSLRFPTDPNALDKGSNLYVVAADADSLEPVYLHTWHENMHENLKASSAIPFLYRQGVEIDGRRLIDGGVADPIPVRWAYQQGARKILVIRTVSADYNGQSPMLERLRPILRRAKQSPRMMEMYVNYQRHYADALRFMQTPPQDLEIIQIAPPASLRSMVLGSSNEVLKYDYLIGKREGRRFLRQWLRGERQRA